MANNCSDSLEKDSSADTASNNAAPPAPGSIARVSRTVYVVVDSHPDPVLDEFVVIDPIPAPENSDQTSTQIYTVAPRSEILCTSKFCGVSGIEHVQGPYLHEGKSAPANRIYPGFPPPWQKANPPPEVWVAWIRSLPTNAGPRREYTGNRSERYQNDIDLVDGFIAHHSWIPDGVYDPASVRKFKLWSDNWKVQREQGITRPKLEE